MRGTCFCYVLHWQHWWGRWLTIPAQFICEASPIHPLSNIWGKVPMFNGSDKHCVITPKKWFAIYSINFSIPESTHSHSRILSSFLIIAPFKIGKNPYCCTKLHVQNEPYHHHYRCSEIPCTSSQSWMVQWECFMNFFVHSFCVQEFFVIIVQYMVLSNNWWIHPNYFQWIQLGMRHVCV